MDGCSDSCSCLMAPGVSDVNSWQLLFWQIRHVVSWLHLNARVCIVLKILLIKSGTYVESWGLLGLTVKAGSSGCCWDHEHITVTLVQMAWGKKFGAILMLRALTCCSASLAHSWSSVAGSLQLCGSFELQRHLLSCMNSVFSTLNVMRLLLQTSVMKEHKADGSCESTVWT